MDELHVVILMHKTGQNPRIWYVSRFYSFNREMWRAAKSIDRCIQVAITDSSLAPRHDYIAIPMLFTPNGSGLIEIDWRVSGPK